MRVRTVRAPVLAVALLAFPLGAAALAASLAARLRPPERAVLAVAGALLAAAALASPVASVHDPWTHYLHLRAALADPARLLDPWDRPGFTLLAAGPAALGIRAARLAAIATALVALAATARAARALGLRRPWLAAVLLLVQADFFGEATSTMTELPFAAALGLALQGMAEGRPWLAAAGLGWLGVTRPEGPAFAALGAAWLAFRARRPGPALASFLPLALYVAIGAAVFRDPRWLLETNPYRGLVRPRLELGAFAQSYFPAALWQSQGPALALLEGAGAALVALGRQRRLRAREAIPARREALDGVAEPGTRRPSSGGAPGRCVEQRREESARRRQPACAAAGSGIASRALTPALAAVLASALLLTFLEIGPTDAWRESRYLVAVGPALALLAAAAVDAALARAAPLAAPTLLAAAAVAAAWGTSWQWSRVGVPLLSVAAPLAPAALAVAALLWRARRRLSPAAAVALLLAVPVVAAPPGLLSRHRADLVHAPAPAPARDRGERVMVRAGAQEGP